MCRMTDAGAQALAALREAPALHSLCLDLSWQAIGYDGALALTSLLEAPSVRVLHLDLRYNRLGAAGALALSIPLEVHRREAARTGRHLRFLL